MTTNHRDEVAELLAEYRRSREQLASVHRALLSIAESASSPDGLITASVDSAGTLVNLTIGDEAYRRHRPAELAEQIVRATRQAAGQAGERARQALAPVLPSAVDPGSVLSGTADLTPAELQPPAPPVRGHGDRTDDETYEDTTWLNGGGR